MSNTSNLDLWDKVRRVPPEHLKGFSRAGGFKGTAIKPMWSVQKMTETFGPVGKGWGIDEPTFTVVPAGDEILVYCHVSVWLAHPEMEGIPNGGRFYGVGGDKVRVVHASGPRNDDEAFKKAYTDALTNALKLLGVGADIHMGLWDGNKYINDKPEPEPEPVSMPSVNGTVGASKAGNRATYDSLVSGIRNAPTVKALADWHKANVTEIDKLPPDWVDELRVEYNDRKSELTKALAA